VILAGGIQQLSDDRHDLGAQDPCAGEAGGSLAEGERQKPLDFRKAPLSLRQTCL